VTAVLCNRGLLVILTSCYILSETAAKKKELNLPLPVGTQPQATHKKTLGVPLGRVSRQPQSSSRGQPSTSSRSMKSAETEVEPIPEESYDPFPVPVVIEGGHAERRKAASEAWLNLLPSLVYPLMDWRFRKQTGKAEAPQSCSCCQSQLGVVSVISFTCEFSLLAVQPAQLNQASAITEFKIHYCEHQPFPVSMIHQGIFSSTPRRLPKWAFDIQLLEYMSKQFIYGTPDISAWCNATSSFLLSLGIEKVPSLVSKSSPW
jgi:hypothetical protein